jgi:hypothetical protein
VWQAGWLAEILDRKGGSENWNGNGKLDRRIGSKTQNWIETLAREIEHNTWVSNKWIVDLANVMIQFYDPISDPIS